MLKPILTNLFHLTLLLILYSAPVCSAALWLKNMTVKKVSIMVMVSGMPRESNRFLKLLKNIEALLEKGQLCLAHMTK